MAEKYIRVEDIRKVCDPTKDHDVPILKLVRCKDCRHNYYNMIPSGEADHGCSRFVELPITADFYCAWGEDDGV